jgi:hypothetical protein
MPVSLSGLEMRGPSGGDRIGWVQPIDKSKFADFKPLSLDVIFHDCKIVDVPKGKIDAFAR